MPTPYISVTIVCQEPALITTGVLADALLSLGYEGFQEEGNTLTAFITSNAFSPSKTEELLQLFAGIESWSHRVIPPTDWNHQWESSFTPIRITEQGVSVYIGASFHPTDPEADISITIDPKMAFGTGHHDTTALMVRLLIGTKPHGKTCLDMGCGTALLALLAMRLGATATTAIDNDEWAIDNAQENIATNGIAGITAILGDFGAIPPMQYDLILANITLNTHLQHMATYAHHLVPGGLLLASGFYKDDIPTLEQAAQAAHFTIIDERSQNHWAAVTLQYLQS